MATRLGPFTLHDILGRGGMGEVWDGAHTAQGVPVAVKMITREKSRSDAFRAGFRHEVRAMARLSHRHIVAIYDHGTVDEQAQRDSGGRLVAGSPWLAMERGTGSIEACIGQWSWDRVKAMLTDVLDALAHAHARGLIHRDIKPENILLVDGMAKLADFGIAHVADRQTAGEASSQGTPFFMAPEQIEGRWRDFGPGTDLFALAATAWMLLCGHPPHDGDRIFLHQLGQQPTIPPFRPVVAVPSGLEPWLRRMIHPLSRQRYPSAAVAAHALQMLDGTERIAPTPIAAAWGPSDVGDTAAWETAAELGPHGAMTEAVGAHTAKSDAYTTALPPTEVPETLLAPLSDTPPPMPSGWALATAPASLHLSGVGLALYGLRPVPLVGREPEQDALWASLCAVCRGEGARAVVLEGEAGVGKSRLADWLSHRAQELGAAIVLSAHHSSPRAASDGLVPMLERHLRTRGLPRPQVAQRLQDRLGLTDLQSLGALTELLCPLGPGEAPQGVLTVPLKTPTKRRAVFLDALRRLSQSQPLVVWLDDVQWGSDALDAAQWMLEEEDLPVLVVLTARSEALLQHPEQAAVLAALAEQPAAQRLRVAALSARSRVRLVEGLLGLSGPLAEEVAARTGGNPLFATQFVGDWVQRGILVVGEGGFVLAEGAEVPIPDAIHTLWRDRLARVLEGEAAAAQEALELAALLGAEVDESEWRDCCDHAGIPSVEAVVEQMMARGMAVPREDGWAFSHGLLAESITRIAEESGREEQHKGVVGGVLLRRGMELGKRASSLSIESVLSRAEGLLRNSSHQKLWLQSQSEVSSIRRQLGRMAEAKEGYSLLLRTARSLGERRMEGDGLHGLGLIHMDIGDFAEALPLFADSMAIRRECGDRRGEQSLLSNMGRIHNVLGDKEHALHLFTEAMTISREHGLLRSESRAHLDLGDVFLHQEQTQEALSHYSQALAISRKLGDLKHEGTVLLALNNLAIKQGRLEDARSHCEQALALHRKCGSIRLEGMALAALGTVKGRLGSLEEAITHYEQALVIHRKCRNRPAEGIDLGNMGDMMLLYDQLEAAQRYLRQAITICDEFGHPAGGAFRGSLGLVMARMGESQQARALLEEGAPPLRRGKYLSELGKLLCKRCEVERLSGDPAAAHASLVEAEQIAADIRATPDSDLGRGIAEQRRAASAA
ncbi:MAG: tetratricopeptide (TPR) repeat protein [Myxococcota bacterium]|jgi:tetratricopeptide (TPR) repeat protein